MLVEILFWILAVFVFSLSISLLVVSPLYSLSLMILSGLLLSRALNITLDRVIIKFVISVAISSFAIGFFLRSMPHMEKIIGALTFVSFSIGTLTLLREEELSSRIIALSIPLAASIPILFASVIVSLFVFLIALIAVVLAIKSSKSEKTYQYPFPDRFGKAISDINPNGYVRVFGEIWEAESSNWKIRKGEEVYVLSLRGTKVEVIPVFKCPVCGTRYPISNIPERCLICGTNLSPHIFEFIRNHTKSAD